MTAKSFGRRGAALPVPTQSFRREPVAAAPAAALDRTDNSSDLDLLFGQNRLLGDLPLLTVGMIALLALIFALERRFAFDIAKDGSLSARSLIAFGATSRDLVVGSGEWWRIGLAPLLHGSTSHLVGNCTAMFFVGLRLEPMIGRGWFALIFVASALAGEAGSLYNNPPGIPGIGASGAITGLIGALFIASFHHVADPDEQRTMRKTSLFFGVPALLPLMFGASGHVDYYAHAGGAIAGAAVAWGLCGIWSDKQRPGFARQAAVAAAISLVLSIACCGFAVRQYAANAVAAAQFMRAADLPETWKASVQRSGELVARFPKDPRAHLMRAAYFLDAHQYPQADAELRTAMTLASSDATSIPVRDYAQALLALVQLEQGRYGEAKTTAAEVCRGKDKSDAKRALAKTKLCD